MVLSPLSNNPVQPSRMGVHPARLILILVLACTGGIVFRFRSGGGTQSPPEVFAQGLRSAENGDFAQVSESIEILAENPGFEAHSQLLSGMLLLNTQNIDDALVAFGRANSHPDTREEAFFQAAKISHSQGRLQECLGLLQQVVKWNPDHIEAHRLSAAVWYDLGTMEAAIRSVDEVIRLDSDDYRPLYMKAVILHDYERYREAADVFAVAIERAKADPDAAQQIRIGWSDTLLRLRQYDQALRVLAEATDSLAVEIRRAEAFVFLRRFDEAREIVGPLIAKAPTNVEVATIAATLDEQAGDSAKAVAVLNAALKAHPYDVHLLNAAANASAAMGDVETSSNYRQRASELVATQTRFSELHQIAATDTENVQIRLELAHVAEQLGKPRIASTWYRAALGIDPQNNDVLMQWNAFQQRYPDLMQPPKPVPEAALDL